MLQKGQNVRPEGNKTVAFIQGLTSFTNCTKRAQASR